MTALIYDWPKSDRLHLPFIYLRMEQVTEKEEIRLVQVFIFHNRLNRVFEGARSRPQRTCRTSSPLLRLYAATEVRQQMQNDLIILSM